MITHHPILLLLSLPVRVHSRPFAVHKNPLAPPALIVTVLRAFPNAQPTVAVWFSVGPIINTRS